MTGPQAGNPPWFSVLTVAPPPNARRPPPPRELIPFSALPALPFPAYTAITLPLMQACLPALQTRRQGSSSKSNHPRMQLLQKQYRGSISAELRPRPVSALRRKCPRWCRIRQGSSHRGSSLGLQMTPAAAGVHSACGVVRLCMGGMWLFWIQLQPSPQYWLEGGDK